MDGTPALVVLVVVQIVGSVIARPRAHDDVRRTQRGVHVVLSICLVGLVVLAHLSLEAIPSIVLLSLLMGTIGVGLLAHLVWREVRPEEIYHRGEISDVEAGHAPTK